MNIDPKLTASQAIAQPPEIKGKKNDPEKLRQSCRDFEALFVHSMFKEMRKTVPEDGLIPRGHSEGIYQEMLDWEMSRQVASREGLGLAEALFRQLNGSDSND